VKLDRQRRERDTGNFLTLKVDRGDPEVAVAELALDDGQRDALAGHLDGMSVTQLMGCEAAPPAGRPWQCVAGRRARLPLTTGARASGR
jgi:hypothetical protein